MRFTELNKITNDLHMSSPQIDFYKMCLCYALQNMFETEDHEPFTKEQFVVLNNIMYVHCEDNYSLSPWEVADAITNCCREYGVEEFISDYDSGTGTMLEDELCNM